MKTIINTLLVITLIIVIAFIANLGFSKEEIVECNKLQAQAEEYPNFYITNWQADMCASHQISINAPVK